MKLSLVALLMILIAATYAQKTSRTASTAVAARDASTEMLLLRISTEVQTHFPGPNFGRIACDKVGNMYARTNDSSPNFMRAPVQEIRADGSLAETFSVADVLKDAVVHGFFVAADGKVYLLAWAQATGRAGYSPYVVKFAADGPLD